MRLRPPLRNPLVGVFFSFLLLVCRLACGTLLPVQILRSSFPLTIPWVAVGTLFIHLKPVNGALRTSHASLLVQEKVSIAKVKFPFVPAVYAKAYTYDTLRTFERYGALTLTPDKIAVMYNWCQDQDTYANDFPGHLYLACTVRIEFFSLSGERLQQEFFDADGTLRVQSSFTFSDPEKYPEMKAVGFWVHGPHEGALSNKIVVALWTAECPEPDATRECVAGKRGCIVSLRKRFKPDPAGTTQESFKDTCTSNLFGTPFLNVYSGLRLCDAGEGSTPWPYQAAPDCFYYDLSATDETGKGWEKPADGKAHGYRMGSISTVSKDGGRYGSVYLVRFSAGGRTLEWARKVSSHAYLDYGEGIENAVHAAEAIISSGAGSAAATEMQYSVTYNSHYWKQSTEGQVLLRRLCHVQIVKDNGELLDAANGGLLNTKCTNCSSQPMARVHPQSHQWMSVCNSSGGDAPGIYLNDQLVVDSLESLKLAGITSFDPDALYSIDTHAQIVPTGVNEWLLFWKSLSTLPGVSVEFFGPFVQQARLMLAKYDAATKTVSPSPTVVVGGLSEPEYGAPRICRFGEKTLLVGFYSSLKHSTTLLEVDEDGRAITTAELHIDRTLVGILLNTASATHWQRHTDHTIYWIDRVAHSAGLDQYEALRPATAYPGFSLHLLKVEGRTTDADCRAQWDSSARCDQSCHILHVLRETAPGGGNNCPLQVGSLRVTPCSGDLCEPVAVAKVTEVTLDDPSRSRSVMNDDYKEDISGKREVRPSAGRLSPSTAALAGPKSFEYPSSATVISNSKASSSTQFQRLEATDVKAALRATLASRFTTGLDRSFTSAADPRTVLTGKRESIGSSSISSLFDRDVTTAIEFSNSNPSSFAVFVNEGGDIHEFSVAFLLETTKWEEGLRLSCAAYDRFGKALIVREGFIGRMPLRNFMKPAGVNVSLWEWTNIRLFGVQAVQCTSGSASLLPAESMPFTMQYSPRFSSAASVASSPAHSFIRQNLNFVERPTAEFLPASSPPAPEKAATTDSWATSSAPSVSASFQSPPPSSVPPSPSLRVAELVVLGRPNGGGACPPEGFFSHAHCSSEASRPVFDLATLDCKGEWSAWTICDENCISTRVFRKERDASWGGKPCQRIQKKPCGDGPYCTTSSFPSVHPNGRPLLPRQRRCSFATGPWSDCLHCRQLRFHHVLAEASGPNVKACPDPVEMRYCNATCKLQYDFAYTATSTYPPATTQNNALPTFVPPPKVNTPLSWRRWHTMGRYTVAAFCLLVVLLIIVVATCVFCSFKGNVQQQQLEGDGGSAADGPAVSHNNVTLAGMRRQTAAAVHAAIVSVMKFAEDPTARTEEDLKGKDSSTSVGSRGRTDVLPCEDMFHAHRSGTLQQPQTDEQSVRFGGISTSRAKTLACSRDRKLSVSRAVTDAPGGLKDTSTIATRRFRAALRSKLFSKDFARRPPSRIQRCPGDLRGPAAVANPSANEITCAVTVGSAPDISEAEATSAHEWEDIDTNSPVSCVTGTENDRPTGYPYSRGEKCAGEETVCCQPNKRNDSFALPLRQPSDEIIIRATGPVKGRNALVKRPCWRQRTSSKQN